MPRVLHILSQRPSLTGSGITLDALVREAARTGWTQHAIVGVPQGDRAGVGHLEANAIDRVEFVNASANAAADLSFAVPGMSDVMPYASTRFSTLDSAQLGSYREVWRNRIRDTVERFRPDVVHVHHTWIVASLVKDVTPSTPVVMHAHGTGLRQLELCPDLAPAIAEGCRRNEALVVLHDDHVRDYASRLGIDRERIHLVGAGYRDDVFHARDRETDSGPTILYAGKLSVAKGLPVLLDAVEEMVSDKSDIRLHVAGGGVGVEADELRERMRELEPCVIYHGRVDPSALADLMRRCSVFALPSLFEGLPLVLVEALACGCRLVSTALPGVAHGLAPRIGPVLEMVELPLLVNVDEPHPNALPGFRRRLVTALERAMAAPPIKKETAELLRPFTWESVFERVESVWRQVTSSHADHRRHERKP